MLRTTDSQSAREADSRRLQAAIRAHTPAELTHIQGVLQQLNHKGHNVAQISDSLRDESAEIGRWLVHSDSREDADKVLVLLAALAVAIAWQTYRARPASADDLLYAFERMESGVAYTLPIPRHKPCFCGREDRYRDCHGRPPMAA